MTESNTVGLVFREIALALKPIATGPVSADPNELPEFLAIVLEGAGVAVDRAIGPDAVRAVVTAVNKVSKAYQAIAPIVERQTLPDLSEAQFLVARVSDAISGLMALSTLKLRANVGAALAVEFTNLGQLLLEYLIAEHLRENHFTVFNLLVLFGAIELGDRFSPKFEERLTRFHLPHLATFVRDPKHGAKEVYGWSDPDFRPDRLLAPIGFLLQSVGFTALFGYPPEHDALMLGWVRSRKRPQMQLRIPLVRSDPGIVSLQAGFAIVPVMATATKAAGLAIVPYGLGESSQTFNAGDGWVLDYRVGGNVQGRYGLVIRFDEVGIQPLDAGTGPVSYDLKAATTLTRVAPATERFVLIGQSDVAAVEAAGVGLGLGLRFQDGDAELSAEVLVQDGAIVVAPPKTDGFLKQILPKDGLRAAFQLGIGWSNKKGLYFRGSAGLEATLPVKQSLAGVVTVDSVYLALRADERNGLRAAAAATTTVRLGPVTANVERFGLDAALTFPPDGGNLGIADLALAFKPPSGAGLVIDSEVVTGGGYLFFDPAKQQYAGVLQLEIAGKVAVKAVGLLTTRLPDNRPGFSLIVVVTAEGFAPMPLGFGFTLVGVGGLIGVNRTVVVETLRAGLKHKTLDSVLFPPDPVANAPQILSALDTVFPAARDRFVFGPMARVTWGTPEIVAIDLALLLEVPAPVRLFVLARLTAALPDKDHPIAIIRMDALGVIDFDRGDLALDATLYDSRLADFALTGDVAVRANWGAQPSFVLAIGGLHPRFNPPPNFPALSRVALSLASGSNPRVRLDAYLALTANTVQFGARIDLYAAVAGFEIVGFFGFDTLFMLAPFSFTANVAGMLALRQDGRVLMGARVEMTLAGPRPWYIHGTATVEFFGLTASVTFEQRIGPAADRPVLPDKDVLPDLRTALADPRNWSTDLPPDEHPLVTVRAARLDARLMHPLAAVTIRQRIVPLDRTITRIGAARPHDGSRFSVTAADVRGGAPFVTPTTVTDLFAPAQFRDMRDEEKLTAPSFEQMPSGLRFTATDFALVYQPAYDINIGYTTLTVGTAGDLLAPPLPTPAVAAAADAPAATAPPHVIPAPVLERAVPYGASAKAAIWKTGRERFRSETL